MFCLGKLTYNLYKKNFSKLNISYTYWPSPSSANANYKLKELINIYSIIKENLDK